MTILKDSHHFSRTLSSLWWQSWKTAITSAELWAVFDDNLERQPSLRQNFGQSLMTIFKDSHHFSRTVGNVWWQCLMATLFSKEPFAAAFGKKRKTFCVQSALPWLDGFAFYLVGKQLPSTVLWVSSMQSPSYFPWSSHGNLANISRYIAHRASRLRTSTSSL